MNFIIFGTIKLVDRYFRSFCFSFGSNHLYFGRAADHPNTLDFAGGFFDNARAIAALSHCRWPEISREKIHRALSRLDKCKLIFSNTFTLLWHSVARLRPDSSYWLFS